MVFSSAWYLLWSTTAAFPPLQSGLCHQFPAVPGFWGCGISHKPEESLWCFFSLLNNSLGGSPSSYDGVGGTLILVSRGQGSLAQTWSDLSRASELGAQLHWLQCKMMLSRVCAHLNLCLTSVSSRMTSRLLHFGVHPCQRHWKIKINSWCRFSFVYIYICPF